MNGAGDQGVVRGVRGVVLCSNSVIKLTWLKQARSRYYYDQEEDCTREKNDHDDEGT